MSYAVLGCVSLLCKKKKYQKNLCTFNIEKVKAVFKVIIKYEINYKYPNSNINIRFKSFLKNQKISSLLFFSTTQFKTVSLKFDFICRALMVLYSTELPHNIYFSRSQLSEYYEGVLFTPF